MGASSAHGPGGRDGDSVRRPGEPGGEPVAWEPVITRPDPMSAEEWQAWADHEADEDTDPEELQDEDDFLYPGELELTEAELAEIAELAAPAAVDGPDPAEAAGTDDPNPAGVDDRDPAGVARVLAAQAAAALSGGADPVSPGRPGRWPRSPPGRRRGSGPGYAWT